MPRNVFRKRFPMSKFAHLLRASTPDMGVDADVSTVPAEEADQSAPTSGNQSAAEEETFIGHLDSMKTYGAWSMGSFWVDENNTLKVTGQTLTDMKEGMYYQVTGRRRMHPTHGESFEIGSYLPHVPLNVSAIRKYLVAAFDGIGEKSAQKMIDHVRATSGEKGLEDFRQQLITAPWEIDWSPIQMQGEYNPAGEETSVAFVVRDLSTRLGGIQGFNTNVIKALAAYLMESRPRLPEIERSASPVQDCWLILAEDPYRPIQHVRGYGFLVADSIARLLNIPLLDPSRLGAMVAYVLQRACDMEGHVYLTEKQLIDALNRLDKTSSAEAAVAYAMENKLIVRDDEFGASRFYPPSLYEAELAVASAVAELMQDSEPLIRRVTDDQIQKAFRFGKPDPMRWSLDKSQLDAVRSIVTSRSRLHILTGGPGSGKTALMETIIRLDPRARFHFCAPTGKAAKVLNNRVADTGNHATTAHSLLKGSEEGWLVNPDNPLEGETLVADEGSMPGLDLYKAIFEALNEDMHIILVGDTNQLQSIQPGRVLQDLLRIPGVNHCHLNTTHRNSGGILEVLREIEQGTINPVSRGDTVLFSNGLAEASDGFDVVLQRYLESVNRVGLENVLLTMSMRQGKPDVPGWNITYANARLREVCNPHAERLPGTSNLHVGDRVIIRDNMKIRQKGSPEVDDDDTDDEFTQRVVNGDTGRILSYEPWPKSTREAGVRWTKLQLDDGRTIDYPGNLLSELDHAYALTVHAAQGSEYQEVICVVTPGAASFINKTSIFTGFSRPRQRLHVFGEDQVLKTIAATPPPRRNSGLVERVAGQTMQEEEQAAPRRSFAHLARMRA